MNANRAAADVLLALHEDEARVASATDPSTAPPRFRFSGDSLGFLAGLLAANLVEISQRFSGVTIFGASGPTFEVQLTPTGRAFVEAWRSGNPEMLRAALGYGSQPAAAARAQHPSAT